MSGVIQRYGMDGLMLATIMAGVILVGLGVARLGAASKFIPHAVTTGFTSGIAVIIFSSQVKDFLGLRMGTVPAEFVAKWESYSTNLGSINPWAVGIGLLALALIVYWPRVSTRLPSPFLALVACTALVNHP